MRTTLRTNPPRPTAMAGHSGDPDMALIGELLEEIQRNAPAIQARKLLVEHYVSVGWLDAALDNVKELSTLVPKDPDITQFLEILQKKPELPVPATATLPSSASAKKQSLIVTEKRVWDPKLGRYKTTKEQQAVPKSPKLKPIEIDGNLEPARQELARGYQALQAKTGYIFTNLLHLQSLQKKAGLQPSKNFAKVQSIVDGQGTALLTKNGGPPGSARSVARTIKEQPDQATIVAITDLENTLTWMSKASEAKTLIAHDEIRDALVKRKTAVESTLPEDLKIHCELALMHVEHENLQRNYANTETMLGDEVKDIPRANFYVTEDNYAWDMDELVQAITVGKGIMRNPLSKEMFTPKDIRGILRHPSGRSLAALAVEQHEMSKGVRTRTIEEMGTLSAILLADQSSDTLPSRKAVDEFLAYVATCKFSHLVTLKPRS